MSDVSEASSGIRFLARSFWRRSFGNTKANNSLSTPSFREYVLGAQACRCLHGEGAGEGVLDGSYQVHGTRPLRRQNHTSERRRQHQPSVT
jgi:hypothetical protein